MRTFTWYIGAMQRHPATGGVAMVEWRCRAQDGKHLTEAYGAVTFEPDPTAQDFVAYEDLTEEMVLAWVRERIVSDGKDLPQAVTPEVIERDLGRQLDDMINPPLRSGMPWAQRT